MPQHEQLHYEPAPDHEQLPQDQDRGWEWAGPVPDRPKQHPYAAYEETYALQAPQQEGPVGDYANRAWGEWAGPVPASRHELQDTSHYIAEARTEQAGILLNRFEQNLAGEQPLDDEYRQERNTFFASMGFSNGEAVAIMRSWMSSVQGRPKEIGSRADHEWQANLMDIMRANYEQLIDLEREAPGAAKELFNNYGIRSFARYDMHDLIRQHNGEANEPLQVMLVSAEDWSDAFDGRQKGMVTSEAQQLGMTSPVFVEAATPIEAFKHLLQVKQNFGTEISGIAVSAHGGPDSLVLSQESRITSDTIVKTNAIERLIKNGTLTPDFRTIFSACYGQKVAQELSRHTKGSVATPGQETSGMYIENLDTGKVKHEGKGRVQIYENGERVDGFRKIRKLKHLSKRVLTRAGVRLAA